MRETKFRACISPKTIIKFTLQDLSDPTHCNLFSFRELLLPWLRAGNKPDEYTGLKDKNGKEIYEGDIVRIEYEVYNPAGIQPKYPQRFKVEAVTYSFAGFSPFCYKPEYKSAPNLLEVTGNIWENPELLGKEE